jgi:RNA polymerase primary sigma factor
MNITNERQTKSERDPGYRYFDEISAIDVMSRDEERANAEQLARLRRSLWEVLLAYAPLADGIADFVQSELGDRSPSAALESYRRTSRAVRDRTMKSTTQAFEASHRALAIALAEIDPDGELSTSIGRDYALLRERRLDGVNISRRRPTRANRRFDEHVAAVRAAEQALRVTRNQFAAANLRLVVKMARRYVNQHLSLHDLVQEGNLGLMKAIDRFDHRRGLRFSTYACWWIRHAIQRAIANLGRTVRVPCHMGDAHARVKRARWQLQGQLGRAPTRAELASATNVAPETIESMERLVLSPIRSLDAPTLAGEDLTLLDTVEDADAHDPLDGIEHSQSRERLLEALTELKPIEVDVLRKRFGLDNYDELTLREVGEQYSLSRERVRQIQEEALQKLRHRLQSC